jgi:hypothetical protein
MMKSPRTTASIDDLPDDMLSAIFGKYESLWQPWVPWAPPGWSPPPPLTPKHLSRPQNRALASAELGAGGEVAAGERRQEREVLEQEEFSALRRTLCLVSKCASRSPHSRRRRRRRRHRYHYP